jgi:capsular polysaccharide biosynthesis protein
VHSPAPAPLFEAPSLPERITAAHRARLLVPPTEFFAVPGHELGGLGLLQQAGRVWVHEAVQPAYLNDAVQPDRLALPDAWTGSLLAADAEIIETDTPVGVALHPNMGYGNFLIEMLPRLLLLARLRAFGRPLPVAVPSDAPTWLQAFVALIFDASETIRYDSRRQRLRAPCFVLPGMMQDDARFHPELNSLVEALLARVVGPTLPLPRPPGRLFLSRRFLRGRHGVANEAEMELAFVDLGFTVVHPQEHALPEQLAMYAGAECIAADYGPAAHNALFAPRGTSLVCVGWRDHRQSGVAALRGQPIAFLPTQGAGFFDPAQPGDPKAPPPRVDGDALSARVKEFLRFAEVQRGG